MPRAALAWEPAPVGPARHSLSLLGEPLVSGAQGGSRSLLSLEQPRSDGVGTHVGRALVSSAAGAMSAAVTGGAVFLVGMLVMAPLEGVLPKRDATELVAALALVGMSTGASLGVRWLGGLLNGRGELPSALVGGFVGMLGSLVLGEVAQMKCGESRWQVFTYNLVLPALFAAVGYELSSHVQSARALRQHAPSASPAPTLLSGSGRF